MSLNGKQIKGVLLDITGVLVESTTEGPRAIKGSVDAVARLQKAGLQVRFVTNETQRTRDNLVEMLHRNGFDMPNQSVFPPALAMASIIKEQRLKPFFLVHPNCMSDLTADDPSAAGGQDFNAVVIGDAVDGFSYRNLNKAFQLIMKTGCPLYSLGRGKYYQEDGELTLDVGPFVAALEFATEKPATVVGKPAADFFQAALKDMNVKAEDAIMVGDDIVSDVGGAQACGLQGVLVRTGKFRPSDEKHPRVKPDKIVDCLEALVSKELNL